MIDTSPARAAPYDREAIERLRRELGIDPQTIRQWRTALLKHARDDLSAAARLPDAFRERVVLHPLELEQQFDSHLDGASKLLFRTTRGKLIETVILRIATGRTTLCVSSQVGCAAACEFCATGKMGVAQDLAAAEILDQVVQANQLLQPEGRRARNLVFMGMGEPFHNERELYAAVDGLLAPDLFHHPASRILVSTVGVPDAMIRFARRFPAVQQALSLHSVRQEVRERLIPLARKHRLDQLRAAVAAVNNIQRSQPPGASQRAAKATVMIEYLMLSGVNDSPSDASELRDWLAGLAVHVNLIPYNPIQGAPELVGSGRATREQFAQRLKRAGLPTTIRYSLGADIAAACGQLVQRANRELGGA